MVPYDKVFRSLVAYSGQRNCWQLKFPHRGWIQRLAVKQVGGTTTAFKVNLFNSVRPCQSGSESSGGVGDADGYYEADPDMYEIFDGPLIGTAGETLKYRETFGQPYVNQDGTESLPQKFIYLEITVDDPSSPPVGHELETTWDVNIKGWTDL